MANLTFDWNAPIGKIKPMHAVGQPPFQSVFRGFNFSHMRHLTDAHIPYGRLHDVGGVFGGGRFVDIPNLFRNFDADENDPASYDFAFTDLLIAAMYEYGVRPIFRLGTTIENQAVIKAYHIHPPKDFAKWARICEHVVRHYNEGWANGFRYGIEYWEIWNEPDNGHTVADNQMWTGTPEEYFELYDVTAKHLKSCFGDSIKVGGYGACGFYGIYYHPEKYGMDLPRREIDSRYERDTFRVEFLFGFLDYITAHGSPIDFFTWHSYSAAEKTLVMDEFLHRVLTKYGLGHLERHMNEWNNAHKAEDHGSSFAAASAAAMLCGMQHSHTDMLCYYDARLTPSLYGGFFKPLINEPTATYYAFRAFGELFALGEEYRTTCDTDGVYCLAAGQGEERAVLIVNTVSAQEIRTDLAGAWDTYLIDREHSLEKVAGAPRCFPLAENQILLLKSCKA